MIDKNIISGSLDSVRNVLNTDIVEFGKEISSKTKNLISSNFKQTIMAAALATGLSVTPNVVEAKSVGNGVETKYKFPYISTSVNTIGIEKVRNFMNYYKIKKGDDNEFRRKVTIIQFEIGINADGVLDSKTYEYFEKKLFKKSNFTQNKKNLENSGNLNTQNKFKDKVNLSKKFAGINEVRTFAKVFGVNREEDFYNKVVEIQMDNGLKIDGVIGNKTLETIYEKYYVNISNLPLESKNRIYLNNVIEDYRGKKSVKYSMDPVGTGKNFDIAYSKNYFYGHGNSTNISGTAINSELYQNSEIPKKSNFNNGNSIQVSQLSNGKYYLALYENGDLKVLSYTSPGSQGHKTPAYAGKTIGGLSSNYISNSYPKYEDGKGGGAVMPLAYNINSGIYGHVGEVTGTGASKGCIRVPGFYQVEIFKILKKNPGIFKFKTLNGF